MIIIITIHELARVRNNFQFSFRFYSTLKSQHID